LGGALARCGDDMTRSSDDARIAKRATERRVLYERAKQGDLGLVEAVRMMRRIAGKTQAEYAHVVGVSPRVLIDFERGVGNPTLRSLQRMLTPFGFELTVRRLTAPDVTEGPPFRYNILDASNAVFAQAHEMRGALDVARAHAKKTSSTSFIRDSKRESRVVASVGADGKVRRARGH
jgi:transcriptional regulator with XRE-family HTH domain